MNKVNDWNFMLLVNERFIIVRDKRGSSSSFNRNRSKICSIVTVHVVYHDEITSCDNMTSYLTVCSTVSIDYYCCCSHHRHSYTVCHRVSFLSRLLFNSINERWNDLFIFIRIHLSFDIISRQFTSSTMSYSGALSFNTFDKRWLRMSSNIDNILYWRMF
jgi:hypothetical protein